MPFVLRRGVAPVERACAPEAALCEHPPGLGCAQRACQCLQVELEGRGAGWLGSRPMTYSPVVETRRLRSIVPCNLFARRWPEFEGDSRRGTPG